MTKKEQLAKEYAHRLWNDPNASPVCQYLDDNQATFIAGFEAAKAELKRLVRRDAHALYVNEWYGFEEEYVDHLGDKEVDI